ncbi:MAG: 1-deoxy-D-xylulose-5-phosphate reductoisomerase [Synergistaceae bacterium]|jgi:1-deoxy-D-xylulose-5-phosphate reductoisomerase|nr:1-deoxy-D-xylulose-5-phosphate reductoisomerase [Synergistaceae bacterium]
MVVRIAVLGATGSVGSALLDICARYPDRFDVVAVAAGSNADGLLNIAKRFRARYASLADFSSSAAERFRASGVTLLSGKEGLVGIASLPEVDHVSFASSGTDAIPALQRALALGKDVSLANKESIVASGPWVMPLVKRPDQLRPVDSEHSAIWQCLRDEPHGSVRKIFLTASGGPFRDWTTERMSGVRPEDALKHPVWAMGAKITIDSATLMNKGIECIEAMQLFSLPPSAVGALIHPAALVHGIVEFSDLTMKMLFSRPDMRLPAAAALAWPERLPISGVPEMELPRPDGWALEFFEPDEARFPCFAIAIEAGRRGGAYPPLLIGADEFAVGAFLDGRIPFLSISHIIEKTLESYSGPSPTTVEDSIRLISEGRERAWQIFSAMEGKK